MIEKSNSPSDVEKSDSFYHLHRRKVDEVSTAQGERLFPRLVELLSMLMSQMSNLESNLRIYGGWYPPLAFMAFFWKGHEKDQ